MKVKLSKNARNRKNVVRENSGTFEQEVSSGKSCSVQQRPQLLIRTTYRGIKQAENSAAINGCNKTYDKDGFQNHKSAHLHSFLYRKRLKT